VFKLKIEKFKKIELIYDNLKIQKVKAIQIP